MLKWNALPWLLLSPVLVACHDGTDASLKTNGSVHDVTTRSLGNQIFIPGGRFIMGDFGAVGEDGVWRPYFPPTAAIDVAHEVTLSDYSIAKHKTTWFEFDTFLLATQRPAFFTVDGRDIPRELYNQTPGDWDNVSHPAQVTWQESKDYCAWLAGETGIDFDLPTSAQWEFAARNRGSEQWLYPTHDGKSVDNSSPYANKIYFKGATGPVGSRLPANPLGLYDMADNGEEWVNDWYSETYYAQSDGAIDPTGPTEGEGRVLRSLGAGSLAFSFSHRMGSVRFDGAPAIAGFRCAIDEPEGDTK